MPHCLRSLPTVQKPIGRRRLAWSPASRAALVLPALGALLIAACIKRQPLPEAPLAASSASASVARPAEATAPTEATGNWGKVPGVPLLGPGGVEDFVVNGQKEKVKLTTVPVTGEAFDKAVRAQILKGSANAWDVQLQAKSVAPVAKGDVILATFTFRIAQTSTDGGDGDTEFVFELGREPWTKSVSFPVRGGKDWKTIRVPFVAAADYGTGEAQAIFRLGYAPQTVELGGVTVENFGKALALADLPTTKPSYRGMSLDAAWRARAEERIAKHRQGELTIVVKDQSGKPVPNAGVHVKLRRHAFTFGTAATAASVLDEKDPKYLETLVEHFNAVTFEQDFAWRALAGEQGKGYTRERTQAAIARLGERGVPVRGGGLVRAAWDAVPRGLAAQAGKPAALRQAVDAHLKETVGAYAGKVTAWSVVDSPYDQRELIEILGEGSLGDWFRTARAADPKVELLLDVTGALGAGALADRQRNYTEATLKRLLAAGTPVDALGIQAQYGAKLTAPEDIIETLERLGSQGKPIVVTRFDPMLDDDELTAEYLRDFYLAVFSSPAAKGVVLWGFWDRAHWRNRAALFGSDWSLKPAGKQYRDLVLGRWRTDERGQTDAQGALRIRGFLGDFAVEVESGGRQGQGEVRLDADGETLEVRL